MFRKFVLFSALILCAGYARAFPTWLGGAPQILTVEQTMSQNATQNSSYTILVDISSNTWPHYSYGTREISIDSIEWNVDKVAASTFTLKVGVVTYVGGSSSGSVTWVWGLDGEKNVSNTNARGHETYYDAPLDCRVNVVTSTNGLQVGVTPNILSVDVTTGTVSITTATALSSPAHGLNPTGTIYPSIGDIVMYFKNNMQAQVARIKLQYHSKSN